MWLYLQGFKKEQKFIQLQSDSVRLDVIKVIPFRVWRRNDREAGRGQSGVSETTEESTEVIQAREV